MQNGASFGEVDRLARKHGVALLDHLAGNGDGFQLGQHGVVHRAFGIVQEKVVEAGAETVETPGVGGKGGPDVGCFCGGGGGFQLIDKGFHGARPLVASDGDS